MSKKSRIDRTFAFLIKKKRDLYSAEKEGIWVPSELVNEVNPTFTLGD
jgi:hypothetical protein